MEFPLTAPTNNKTNSCIYEYKQIPLYRYIIVAIQGNMFNETKEENLLNSQASQIIVMLAIGNLFAQEAILFGIHTKSIKIDIQSCPSAFVMRMLWVSAFAMRLNLSTKKLMLENRVSCPSAFVMRILWVSASLPRLLQQNHISTAAKTRVQQNFCSIM